MKVVVAGAGFAGLACAERLVAHGHEVSVFEARTRVGGRVWSQRLVPDDPETVVERGAEFVLAGYTRLRDIAGRLGLSLVDTGMSYYVREPRGVATTSTAMATAGRQLAEAARTAPAGLSLLELSSRLHGNRAAIDACVARISLSCAFPAGRLSCHAALEGIAETEWQPSHRVLGGNQLIASGLAERLGDRLRTGAPVTAVTSSAGEVRVRCGGADVYADAVVVAVPASLISGIDFAPALPSAKLAALDRLGCGQAAKLHIPLSRRSPASAVFDVLRGYWCWTANGASGQPAPVLHCFAGGEQALEGLRVDAGSAEWVAAVGDLRPDLALLPARAVVTAWRDDPWAGMAYSASTTQQLPGDADALAASCGRVHFAGEHTAGAWASLMEGALRSGVRAAEEIENGPATG